MTRQIALILLLLMSSLANAKTLDFNFFGTARCEPGWETNSCDLDQPVDVAISFRMDTNYTLASANSSFVIPPDSGEDSWDEFVGRRVVTDFNTIVPLSNLSISIESFGTQSGLGGVGGNAFLYSPSLTAFEVFFGMENVGGGIDLEFHNTILNSRHPLFDEGQPLAAQLDDFWQSFAGGIARAYVGDAVLDMNLEGTVTEVPEPSALALLGLGLLGLGMSRRKA